MAGGTCWEEGGGTDCFFTSRRVIWGGGGGGGGLSPDPNMYSGSHSCRLRTALCGGEWNTPSRILAVSHAGCMCIQYTQYAAAYIRTLIAVQFMCYGL